MGEHPEFQAEQAFLDAAYDRLREMREAVAERIQEVLKQRGGTFQAVTERDIVVRTGLQRLEQLDIGRESLVFGRIDEEEGDVFHIGRLAVSSRDQEPMVVDWRAPVAEPFYRATGRHPMGLRRRRHFATEGRRLVGMEDEVFGEGRVGLDGDDESELVGTGALLAALERSRSGSMRDIVATVQKEQDEVIRAELPGVLVVQGGPGTGKTAVALHRAAYLLYTHRFPLERQGVLVVGPNPLFLRYIDQVLPSLGETGVALTTVEGLVADVRARGVDTAEAARVKGDARMARVVTRAVRDRQRALRREVVVAYGGVSLTLSPAMSEEVVAQARRRAGPHNSRRRFVETLLRKRLHQQYVDVLERQRRAGVRGERGEEETDATDMDVWREVRRDQGLAEALDRMWPVLTPQELLHDLYGAPALLQLAGRGVLTEAEAASLHRPRASALEAIEWSAGDIPLLDEARVVLGTRRAGSHEEGEVRNYGHIVVDEAQDLTPMQLRMLARRSLSGSMTVVGDIAQATGPRAPAGWDDITSHLPTARRPARVVELTINYRTPAEIMDVAGRVLAVAAPHLRQPRSVRSTETPPQRVCVGSAEQLGSAAASVAAAELERVAGGTVAVIAPGSLVASVGAGLGDAGVAFGEPDRTGLEAPITLVPVGVVKGLEFDSVVVVEPSRIVAESPQGLRALYVALTRATKRMTIVHSEQLPAPLASLP